MAKEEADRDGVTPIDFICRILIRIYLCILFYSIFLLIIIIEISLFSGFFSGTLDENNNPYSAFGIFVIGNIITILTGVFFWYIAPKSILFPMSLLSKLNKKYKIEEFYKGIKNFMSLYLQSLLGKKIYEALFVFHKKDKDEEKRKYDPYNYFKAGRFK